MSITLTFWLKGIIFYDLALIAGIALFAILIILISLLARIFVVPLPPDCRTVEGLAQKLVPALTADEILQANPDPEGETAKKVIAIIAETLDMPAEKITLATEFQKDLKL